MIKPKVLLTRAVFPDVIARLAGYVEVETNQDDIVFSEQELLQKMQGKQGVITPSSARFSAGLIAQLPELKAICAMTVGYDNIDVAACEARGVVVTNAPDVLNQTTADFAWALLLSTARRVTESGQWLRDGQWKKWQIDGFLGADVHGKTLKDAADATGLYGVEPAPARAGFVRFQPAH